MFNFATYKNLKNQIQKIMMKKLTLLLSIATLFSTTITAQSFTALYSFDSVKTTSGLIDPSPVPTATGVTFGSFSATGTSVNPNAAGRFSYTGWEINTSTGTDLYSTMTGLINTTKYYEVTVTPTVGFSMTLSSITFKLQRSPTGIRTYAVRSNADAYGTNLPASIAPANTNLSVQTGDVLFWNLDAVTNQQSGSTITLSGTNFTNSTTAKTFRFYAWNADGTGGTFGIDTVLLNGSVTSATAITSFQQESSIAVYPNPSVNGLFTVNLGNPSNKTMVTVYNIIGKIIYSKEINSSKEVLIDLSNEANGSYFINIMNDKESSTKKITINK